MAGYASTDRYVITDGGPFAERKPQQTTQYSVYYSSENDSFEKLASIYLGNPRLYWRIADINPHIEWPDRIPAGTSIRIPL